jgi:hypothetical protein
MSKVPSNVIPNVNLFSGMKPLTKEQLQVLLNVFPDASPRLGDTLETVWYKAGQASVIRRLEDHATKFGDYKPTDICVSFQSPKSPPQSEPQGKWLTRLFKRLLNREQHP